MLPRYTEIEHNIDTKVRMFSIQQSEVLSQTWFVDNTARFSSVFKGNLKECYYPNRSGQQCMHCYGESPVS